MTSAGDGQAGACRPQESQGEGRESRASTLRGLHPVGSSRRLPVPGCAWGEGRAPPVDRPAPRRGAGPGKLWELVLLLVLILLLILWQLLATDAAH